MRRYTISVLIVSALPLLAGCNDAAEADAKAFAELGVRPLPASTEFVRQRDLIANVNRCLGLLQAAASVKDEKVIVALKERGVSKITSDEILPLVIKAQEIEQKSSLMDHEIEAIVDKARAPLGPPQQLRLRVHEIVDCAELSRLEALKSSR